jgi:hypothetical protein
MKIIAHTPQGTFESSEDTQTSYEDLCEFMEKLPQMSYVSFHTTKGKFFLTKEMIGKSVFVIEK